MAYVLYATQADVSSYTGKPVGQLPANIDVLIRKASDLITNSMIEYPYIVPLPPDIKAANTEAMKLATCAQVEYWFDVGDQDQNTQTIQSYSAASTSVTFKDTGQKRPLCMVARSYLNKQGLLYRGVGMAGKWTERSDELWW